ncbi:MAG: PDZ domain-containing protein, partial [Chloroflexi bacterium]
NNHVIEGTQSITVQIAGSGPTYTATVIGDDPAADIALLQIHGVSSLRTVVLGDSSAVTVGESITAIGNALGRGGVPATATGTVTALDQTVTAGDQTGSSETLSGTIRVNAAIQPGDSGGPVVNDAGQVISMTTAGSTAGGYREQFGATTTAFAISINQAMTIVREIQAGGAGDASVHIGAGVLLGVEVDSQAGTSGAAVVGVQAGSPAAAAGLAAGDTVTAVGGQSVASSADLRSALQRHSPGDSVSVTWIDASGSQHTATVQLVAGPPA